MIQAILTVFTTNQLSFSSFDVTKQLRTEGQSVKHGVIRDECHDLYQAGHLPSNYCRTSVNLPSGVSAFIFHPISVDPSSYDPDQLGSTPLSSYTSVPIQSEVRGIDGDGRVFVPPKFGRALGLKPGSKAQLSYPSGKLVITVPGSDISMQARGHIRINPKSLSKAGIPGYLQYQVDLFPNRIEVTPV